MFSLNGMSEYSMSEYSIYATGTTGLFRKDRTYELRIDLVITELDTGGAERCCVSLAGFLLSNGHQVRVIAFGARPAPEKEALHLLLLQKRIEVHYLGGRKWWMFPKVVWKFRKLLRADRPDLVQSFLWHANVLSACVVPSLGIPLVGGARVAEPNRSRHRWGGWAARRMAKVVCVSNGVKQWSESAEHVAADRIEVIPNGIEISEPPPPPDFKACGLPSNPRILLFVGRLNAQKGFDMLLKMVPSLLAQLPNHQLIILGDGPLRSLAESTSKKGEIGGRMKVLGQRDDVRSWMAASELLLLPTRYEGMPNVVLEAMAEGLPVVTMNVHGVQELLGNTTDIQSVPAGEWDLWLNQVVRLANDESLRSNLKALNQKRVREEFLLESQMKKYEKLYQTVFRS